MAGSEYYDHTSYPSTGASGSSSAMRAELELIESGFGKLPALAGNGGKVVTVNAGGTALEATEDMPAIGVAAGNVVQVDQAITAWTRSATTTLGTTLNGTLSATGTTITAFNGIAGVTYHCRALGTGQITHHATDLIITQTGASITTAAGDTFDVEMITATTCRIKNYLTASGVPLSLSSSLPIIGTTLSITGGQIAFPATQNPSANANTLDDYEEGSWTVTLYDAGTGGNASPTTTTGYYTKIGNMVTCHFTSLNNIDTTGMTGANLLYISLPFAAAASRPAAGAITLESFTYPTSRVEATPVVSGGATRAFIRATASAQTVANFSVASISTGVSDIDMFSITYQV